MLLILYGATSMIGNNSSDYLESRGFYAIEKYAYAPKAPIMSDAYRKREYVSQEEFYENTDSLFRYELGGVYRGFNQAQIADAVANKTNALLMIAASNIDFVAKIKRIYEDKVCLVYMQTDDTTLKSVIHSRPGISPDEEKFRFEIGQRVKENYVAFCRVFDKVVIYGGEDSVFNYKTLYRQFDAIIDSLSAEGKESEEYADVFVSYSHRDMPLCHAITERLQSNGVSVFCDKGISPGVEWKKLIDDVILHAKVFVPIITASALRSVAVTSEIETALGEAQSKGTLIVPLFFGDSGLDSDAWDEPCFRESRQRAHELFTRLSDFSGVTVDKDDVEGAALKLTRQITLLLGSGEELKLLSGQIDNYLCLKMYEPAIELQKKHVSLCIKAYELSGGTYISAEAVLASHVKLIGMLLDIESHEEALSECAAAISICGEDAPAEALFDKFAICCVKCRMSRAQVSAFVDEMLSPDAASLKEILLSRFDKRMCEHISSSSAESDTPDNEKTQKIALYGETIIDLFDNLISEADGGVSNQDLIQGYERILNYCKHLGIKGDIADKCISRIAELKQNESKPAEASEYANALKIYLGQARIKSGEYDAFISYKSQDEVLAQKVYDYLTQTGKEVFFAKESLARLGQSEYEEAIFDALEKSKHMVLVASDPDYLKTPWVREEWDTFNNEIREGRKDGNLVLVLTDSVAYEKGRLPIQLRQKEIVKMSEYKVRLINYLR